MFFSALKRLITCLLIFLIGLQARADESLILSGSDSTMDHYIFSNILKQAYSTLGINTGFTPLPSSRSLVNADRGITDGEIARIKGINKQYKNLIRVPIAIMTSGVYALSLSKFPIKNWKDVSKYNVAYRRGIQVIKNELNKHQIQSGVVSKDTELIHFLLRQRTDIVLQDKGLAISSMAQLQSEGINTSGIQFIEPPLFEVKLYHYLNKKHQHLLAAISQALNNMKKSGELEKKINQYYHNLKSK